MKRDNPLSSERVKRLNLQTAEFIALEALIVQNRRLSMIAIVDDDYPAAREEWELVMHHFLQAVVKNRPNQIRMILTPRAQTNLDRLSKRDVDLLEKLFVSGPMEASRQSSHVWLHLHEEGYVEQSRKDGIIFYDLSTEGRYFMGGGIWEELGVTDA